MVVFTLMFAGLMLLSAPTRRRVIAVSLIGCLAILVVTPAPAPGQGRICLACIIRGVLDTINNVIGNWLNLITGVLTNIRNFYQQVVWPLSLINQAKAQITAMISQFRGLMQSIFSINPHAATLPNPVAMEIILRNRQTSDLGSVGQPYVNTFRPVPQTGLMAPQDRDMTDMDDAMAQNTLKTLKMSDQAQDLMLQAADQIEDLAGDPDINHMAPGSAAFLTASAVAASVKSEAIMQKMLAAAMRQEAARIAHDNALRKRRSALAVELQNDLTNILQRR
jgi:TM2 domain-containing membrane protein YozV